MTPNDLLFVLLLMIVCVDSLGVNFTVPLLVPFGEYLGASLQVVAWGGTLRFMMNTLSMLWMPFAADNCGRRLVIISSLVGSAAGYFMQGAASFAGKVPMWIGGRMVSGFFGGTLPVIQATLMDISMPDTQLMKKRTVMLNTTQQALGFMLAPIAGSIANLSLELPYYVCAISAGVTLICVLISLREVGKHMKKKPREQNDEQDTGLVKIETEETERPWCDTVLLSFLVAFFFVMLFFMGYVLLIPKMLEKESFGLRSEDKGETAKKVSTAMGLVTLPQGLFSVVASGILFVPLSNRLGDIPLITMAGGITIAASFGFSVLPTKVWHVALLQSILGIGFGLLTPAMSVAKHVSKHYKKRSAQAAAIPAFGFTMAGLFGQILMATAYQSFGMMAAWMLGVFCVIIFMVFFVTGHKLMIMKMPKVDELASNRQQAELKLGSVDADLFIEALCEEVRNALMENKINLWNATICNIVNKNVVAACQPQLRAWNAKTHGQEYLQDLRYLLRSSPGELTKLCNLFPYIDFHPDNETPFPFSDTIMSV